MARGRLTLYALLFLLITINYAALSLDDSRLVAIPDRLPAGAPITINGGSLDYYGRDGTQVFGAIFQQ